MEWQERKEGILYIYDWFNEVRNHAIGHSIVEIRQAFFRQFGIKEGRLLVFDTHSITVVADRAQYENLLQEMEQMNFICYNFIKKHDPLNLLKAEDIHLTIRLKDDIDPFVLNSYQMKGI